MMPPRLVRRLRGDGGQVLPLVVVCAVVLIGFTGLAVDLARVWITQQELQRAVDAAALAAGQDLPNTSDAYSAAVSYSGTGTRNVVGGWGVTPNDASVTFECVSHGPTGSYTPSASGGNPTCLTDTSNDSCHPTNSNTPTPAGVTTCNAVNVTETAKVSTSLLSFFFPSFTVKASSTASARQNSGVPKPLNIFVILDTTGSMTSGCSGTVTGISSPDKLDCAKAGVRALLQTLPYTSVSGTEEADDDVGISVFPALSTTLTGTPSTTTDTGSLTGSAVSGSTSMSVTADASQYVGYTISGTGISSSSGTTITAAHSSGGRNPTYTVTLSKSATARSTNASYSLSKVIPITGAPYSLPTTPPMTPPDDETDCKSNDSFGVTYPPYSTYTYSATATTTGGIPASVLGNFSNYTSPGYIDDFPGYEAVPLSSDYQSPAGSGTLNTTNSSLVDSVDWSRCSGQKYPGGDYYGLKDIAGQGSYLAGAITASQYYLSQSARTTGPTGQSVTNAIIILSDGELGNPSSSKDGVDPGASGNVGFTSSTPCEDAYQAAKAAKADGTLIFTIAYDDSNAGCDDTGNGSGPANSTCTATSYSGTGPYDGSACGLMAYLATSSAYAVSQSGAGDLTADFTEAGNQLTGDSDLIPDCTLAPPNC